MKDKKYLLRGQALSTLWKRSCFNSFQIRFRDIYILCIAISEILLFRSNLTVLFTLKIVPGLKIKLGFDCSCKKAMTGAHIFKESVV